MTDPKEIPADDACSKLADIQRRLEARGVVDVRLSITPGTPLNKALIGAVEVLTAYLEGRYSPAKPLGDSVRQPSAGQREGVEVMTDGVVCPDDSCDIDDGGRGPYDTAPPADPAKASEPDYDRSLIADMLTAYHSGADDLHTIGAIMEQIRLLRAADNTDGIATAWTAKASGSAPDGWRIQKTGRDEYHVVKPNGDGFYWCRAEGRDGVPFELAHAIFTATPPASAPEAQAGDVPKLDIILDARADVYVATSRDVPGLVVEASTIDELRQEAVLACETLRESPPAAGQREGVKDNNET